MPIPNLQNGNQGFFGSQWNKITGNKDFERQKILQNRQMIYGTAMSSTAAQRGAWDMKRAGINPALMAGQAPVSSTPSSSGGGIPSHGRGNATATAITSGFALANYLQKKKQMEMGAAYDAGRTSARHYATASDYSRQKEIFYANDLNEKEKARKAWVTNAAKKVMTASKFVK